jgi:hypothetical protein
MSEEKESKQSAKSLIKEIKRRTLSVRNKVWDSR